MLTPTNSFYFGTFLCLCQFWWKWIKRCDRESAHGWLHRYTDSNQFYNLSHATCYSYEAENKINWPHGSLATMLSDSGPGSPTPTPFSAAIRNWYSLPSTSSVTRYLVSGTGWRVMRIQRSVRPLALRSTWYPVTGDPPSWSGGRQDSWHESLVTSSATGADGGPGGSGHRHNRQWAT